TAGGCRRGRPSGAGTGTVVQIQDETADGALSALAASEEPAGPGTRTGRPGVDGRLCTGPGWVPADNRAQPARALLIATRSGTNRAALREAARSYRSRADTPERLYGAMAPDSHSGMKITTSRIAARVSLAARIAVCVALALPMAAGAANQS